MKLLKKSSEDSPRRMDPHQSFNSVMSHFEKIQDNFKKLRESQDKKNLFSSVTCSSPLSVERRDSVTKRIEMTVQISGK